MTMYDADNPDHIKLRYRGYKKEDLPERDFCRTCGQLRDECTCDPKCEADFADQVIKNVVDQVMSKTEELCREAASMGWGYRVAVQYSRKGWVVLCSCP